MTRDPYPDPERTERAGARGEERSDSARDDYLWDCRGAPDPTVAALESALAAHRCRRPLPDDAAMVAAAADLLEDVRTDAPDARHERRPRRPSRREARPRVLTRAVAAGLVTSALVCLGLVVWRSRAEPDGPGPVADAGSPAVPPASDAAYRLRVVHGAPRLDGAVADPHAALALGPGAAVETDAASRARVSVGDIGAVELHPGSRLRVGSAADAGDPAAGYLLHLDRGALTASILAAPRLFQLGTPSGLAVDMGCVYTASVAADGVTHLHVEVGQVSFEAAGRRVLVPTGAATRAWPGVGPGTPVWDDAPESFASAVHRFDERVLRDGEDADPALLDELLSRARPQDSLSLWHLLAHARGPTAPRVYERLAALEPPPLDVTREACLAGDRAALHAWRDVMGWAWLSGATGK